MSEKNHYFNVVFFSEISFCRTSSETDSNDSKAGETTGVNNSFDSDEPSDNNK
jgi:hypothetical protein